MSVRDQLKDLYIRYNILLGTRYTKKEKDTFIRSIQEDFGDKYKLKIEEYDDAGNTNIYFGNIVGAKKIIATYYDTPATYNGDYVFFNEEHRKNQITRKILINTGLYLIPGIFFTYFHLGTLLNMNDMFSAINILIMIGYFLYFLGLGRISKGLPKKRNTIRNNSSLLLILEMLPGRQNNQTAYALVAEGTKDESGLQELRRKNKHAQIYYLDSIGSQENLLLFSSKKYSSLSEITHVHHHGSERINRIISGREVNGQYILSRNILKEDQLNEINMHVLYQYLTR